MKITQRADQIYHVIFSYKIKPKYLILGNEGSFIINLFILLLFYFITEFR